MNLRKFTALAVIAVFTVVIIVSVLLRVAFTSVSQMIVGGINAASSMISVTDEGVSIADYIKIDSNGVRIGSSSAPIVDISDSGVKVDPDMGGSFDAIDVTESGFEQYRYTFDAKVNRALDIDVLNCDVVIASSDNDAIIVDVLESDDFRYSFATSSNTLTVRDNQSDAEQQELNILGFKLSLGAKERKNTYTGLGMVVYLPEGFDGEINVGTSNGAVKLGNLKLGEKLSVVTSNANVSLSNIDAYEISAVSSNGRMSLEKLSATEISAITSDSRIELSEITAKRVEAVTCNASIDFSRLFGEKFSFETSNGDIDGSILGSESLFSIETVTDRSAYPKSVENPRAQYRLSAKTSGGDISVSFID